MASQNKERFFQFELWKLFALLTLVAIEVVLASRMPIATRRAIGDFGFALFLLLLPLMLLASIGIVVYGLGRLGTALNGRFRKGSLSEINKRSEVQPGERIIHSHSKLSTSSLVPDAKIESD